MRSLLEFLFGKTDHLDDLDEQARRRIRQRKSALWFSLYR